jgi:tetratricopeptide (TPR) repeat protein
MRPGRAPVAKAELGGRARGYYAYCLAQQAMLERDYASAAVHLERALEADPGSAELHTELARVYLSLGRAEDSLGKAREAARLDPSDPEPRRFVVDLFRLELSRNESPSPRLLDEAEAAHAALLDLDPDNGEVRLSLARIHFSRGSYAQAAAVLRPRVHDEPSDADAAFLLGRALARSGSVSEALVVLERAATARPEVPELRSALAEAREKAGDLAGAVDVLEGLVSTSPTRPDYRFSLARLHELQGDHQAAAKQAAFLVDQLDGAEPGTREEADLRAATMFLVETTASAGENDRALELVAEAAKRFPSEDRFELKRAELLFHRRNDAEADSILDRLAARKPEPVPSSRLSMVLLRAGAGSERAGDPDRAKQLLRRAILIDTGNHAALNYLGYMLADRDKNLDEAVDLIRRAILLDESNGAYHDSLGWALFRMGRFDEAEAPLLLAARSIPDEAIVHDHLGDLYWAQGRASAAVQAWEEAIRLGIDEASVVEAKIRRAAVPPSER